MVPSRAVQRISELEANRPVAIGTDHRTIPQVIAHIAEWERFGIMAAGDILDNTTMGWCMWIIYLDHEAVEHATELKLPFA